MGLFNRTPGHDDHDTTSSRWLQPPSATEQAVFDQAEFTDGCAILRWQTPRGALGLAHSLIDGNATCTAVVSALRRRHEERLAGRYACVVVAQSSTQVTVSDPHVPQLFAYDLATVQQYETTWRQLAAVLGQRAPNFFAALRDRDAIAAWRPGAPPAQVPACHATTPVSALAELAAGEPEGSPAAAVCWHLAREVRRRDHTTVTTEIARLRENIAEQGDGAHLVLGAVPAELRHPKPVEPPEVVRRAGWLAITERRDVLAHRAADFAQRWDGGQDWHTGAPVSARPSSCPTAREWATRLQPADRDQYPSVLEKMLLGTAPDASPKDLLTDPVTGIPAVRSHESEREIATFALQRLPTNSPLAALTVSSHMVWIRTLDDTLWFAPERPGYGVSWGYPGTGCHALAELLDALLNDISAPAMTTGAPEAPRGLLELLTSTPQDGSTTYTRDQLLAARAS
ncbi:hypothetical protein [Streptomyces alboflavus]|uniref:hypothetical protein n=1 Tax=Streptomyces alboflavus TaxID=67267 RepID=UPI000F6567E5|nr:hypothetical protein [Streptomyces alboflavus]